jgi:hypothetical protein
MTSENRRKLLLISKCMQSLGNGVLEFKKEEYMIPMSTFLTTNMEKVKNFFHELAVNNVFFDFDFLFLLECR